ncbi:Pre-mRNA-splicing factor cef1 [Ceratobasidium sp. 392]|nr:Pre-mRNA-splicing factor cef1 [Ceratobasidium sp. 392]
MTKEAAKAAKVKKKLNVTLGGYSARSTALAKRIKDGSADLLKTYIEYESFARLHATEQAAAPRRVNALKEAVEHLERREHELQARFQDLTNAEEEVQARISAKDEQIMMEAEAPNEAALAAIEDLVTSRMGTHSLMRAQLRAAIGSWECWDLGRGKGGVKEPAQAYGNAEDGFDSRENGWSKAELNLLPLHVTGLP